MTRNEAHQLAFHAAKNLEGKEVDQVIKIIEALGLIKFDEEVNACTIIITELSKEFDNPVPYEQRAEKVIKALYIADYVIVKKDRLK